MRVRQLIFYIFLFTFALIMLVPFLWMVYASLVVNDLEVNTSLFDLTKYGFDNYVYILTASKVGTWYKNSIIVTGIITLCNLLFNSMAGYTLARIPFRGRKLFFILTLGIMMVPVQILLIPIFIMMVQLQWINSYWALTVPFLVSPFGVFLMRQYFIGFPTELEQAAKIDGLSRIGIFFRIALPLSGPALIAQAIFIFVWNWNSFIFPSILATDPDIYTLPVGIYQITRNAYVSSVTKSMTGVVLMTIPTLVFFAIFQKYFVRSIANVGLKG